GVLSPNTSATDDVVIGGTTLLNSDISFDSDGSAVFNEQGNAVDFRVEGDTVTDLFVVDASDDDVDINGGLNINLPADDSVILDGSTNQRTIDTGLFQITQTPTIENTRAINITLDINSQATSHAQVTNITATGLLAGETATAYDTNVDRSNSTGGVIRGYEMSISGAGTAVGHLLHADPGIIVLNQFSGEFINVEQAWFENGGFSDVTIAFNTTVNDVSLFTANGVRAYVGMASAFNEIRVNLDTPAGGAGIKPVFEYSSGGGTPVWTVFTPQDETQGFRQTGIIGWVIDDLVTPTWAVATVNSVSKLYIRITRTQASIPTDPIEDTIQVVKATVFFWDENGKIFVGMVTTGSKSSAVTTEGNSETSQIISHINDTFSETIEFTAMRHSDSATSGATFYGIRSRGTHASQSVVQDNDVLFWLRTEGHDGTDFNDAASIFFKVDGTPGTNDMPGRIEFYTSPDGSNALAKRVVIDSTGLFTIEGLTGSEILATDASKGLVSLAVATYPSLAELIHVKGVTSSIQTQIDGKQPLDAELTTIAALTETNGGVMFVVGGVWTTDTTPAIDGSDFTNIPEDTTKAGIADAENISGTWEIQDDVELKFGNDADYGIKYDETVDNQMLFTTTATAAVAITDPMYQFLVGTTPTADQQVFGVAKGTQASNTPLFTIDEDGDTEAAGYLKAGGTKTQIISIGTAPAVSSCGTSPSISATSTDLGGTVTIGSSASSTCTITFDTAYTNAPSCIVTGDTIAVFATTSTTVLTITDGAGDFSSDVIMYNCTGQE
ncbi:MAG: hypothetical protein ACUZ8H_06730, partial [Candidatus Anammoxibacter sp.]